jgi:hypothetical protein
MWFVLAAVFAAGWMLGLAAFSFWTANPITLNPVQIRAATDIITATVEDASAGTVRVEHSWKQVVTEMQLELPNLSGAKPANGDRLLIPVNRTRVGWQVTPPKLSVDPPFVYPATPEAEAQLRRLLPR